MTRTTRVQVSLAVLVMIFILIGVLVVNLSKTDSTPTLSDEKIAANVTILRQADRGWLVEAIDGTIWVIDRVYKPDDSIKLYWHAYSANTQKPEPIEQVARYIHRVIGPDDPIYGKMAFKYFNE